MLECVILFLNHKDDEITKQNYRSFRDLNPYPVIPIHYSPAQPIERSVCLDHAPLRWDIMNRWGAIDTTIYRWYETQGIEAERYIFIESDTYATMGVKEFYGDLWDADAVGSHIYRKGERHWDWFGQEIYVVPKMRKALTGVVPLSCCLLSRRVLEAINKKPMPYLIHCELRLATMAAYYGFTWKELPKEKQAMIGWNEGVRVFDPTKPGIYHPVKVEVKK